MIVSTLATVAVVYIYQFVCFRRWLLIDSRQHSGTNTFERSREIKQRRKNKNDTNTHIRRHRWRLIRMQISFVLILLLPFFSSFLFIIFRFHLNWMNGCFIKTLFDFIVCIAHTRRSAYVLWCDAFDRLCKAKKERKISKKENDWRDPRCVVYWRYWWSCPLLHCVTLSTFNLLSIHFRKHWSHRRCWLRAVTRLNFEMFFFFHIV